MSAPDPRLVDAIHTLLTEMWGFPASKNTRLDAEQMAAALSSKVVMIDQLEQVGWLDAAGEEILMGPGREGERPVFVVREGGL